MMHMMKCGNKLSFAIALLDDNDTGFMLNNIYSKHGSMLYVKKVEKGIVDERISEEEAQALQIAINNKINTSFVSNSYEISQVRRVNKRSITKNRAK